MTREQLLPQELLKQIPKLYSNENAEEDKIIVKTKYFLASFTWLVTECEVQEDGDVLFYGYVINHGDPECSEWGYFTLHELMEVRLHGYFEVERDLYFHECSFGEYMEVNFSG